MTPAPALIARRISHRLLRSTDPWRQKPPSPRFEPCSWAPLSLDPRGHARYRSTSADQASITVDHVRAGVEGAVRRAGRMIHEPALRDLSGVDRSFLAAMAIDDGPSRIANVARRMSVDLNYANQYRRRLLDAEMITAAGRAGWPSSCPYLRGYLIDHPVTKALSTDGPQT